MTKYIKSTFLVIAGLVWIAFAVLICIFLYGYLAGGAGLQVFGFLLPMSPMTTLFGLVHFIGFAAAAFVSFLIGIGLFAHGVVPAPEPEKKTVTQPKTKTPSVSKPEVGLRCVRCETALAAPVPICPECAWTQPVCQQTP